MCENRLDLRLVPLLELDKWLGAECGEHCYYSVGKALGSYYPKLVANSLAIVATMTRTSCLETADDVHIINGRGENI